MKRAVCGGLVIAMTLLYACGGDPRSLSALRPANHPWPTLRVSGDQSAASIWPFEPQEHLDEDGPAGAATLDCSPHGRWPVKTMTDANAGLVNLTPQNTTIAALRAVVRPSPNPLPSEFPTRLRPYEFSTFQLSDVMLVEIFPPGSDRDYHLVLQDATGQQFIAESVNMLCAPGSAVAAQIQSVRNFIDAHFPIGVTPIFPNALVTVTGVGFFDPFNGAPHPPSGAELHPLMSMTMPSPPSPRPSPSPALSPSSSASPSGWPSPLSTAPGPPATTIYYPGVVGAPNALFYTVNESGAVAQQMDPIGTGTLSDQTLTYQPSSLNSSWGWISGSNEPGLSVWPATTFNVVLNVVRPNAALQIDEVKIYRVDSNGGPRYVGLAVTADLKGFTQSLGSTGKITFSVAGARQVANPTDRLAVKFYIHNTSSSPQSFSYDAGATALSNVSFKAATP